MRAHPDVVSGVQVDRGDSLVRRLDEREPLGPRDRHRPRVGEVPNGGRRRVCHQFDSPESGLRRHEHASGLRVDRGAVPVHAAARPRRLNDRFPVAPDIGRHEERTHLGPLGDPDRVFPKLGCEVDQVVHRDALQVERCGFGRERLRGGVPLARYVAG